MTPFRSVADNQLRTQAINHRHYNNALAVFWKKKGIVSIIYFCAGEQTNEETEKGCEDDFVFLKKDVFCFVLSLRIHRCSSQKVKRCYECSNKIIIRRLTIVVKREKYFHSISF